MNVSELHPEEALDLYEAGRLGPRELRGAAKPIWPAAPAVRRTCNGDRTSRPAWLNPATATVGEARRLAAAALARQGIPAPAQAEGGAGEGPALDDGGGDHRDLGRLGRGLRQVLAVHRAGVATPECAGSTGAAAPGAPPGRPRRRLGRPEPPAAPRRPRSCPLRPPGLRQRSHRARPQPPPGRHFRPA